MSKNSLLDPNESIHAHPEAVNAVLHRLADLWQVNFLDLRNEVISAAHNYRHSDANLRRCVGITRHGTRCSVVVGGADGRCAQHYAAFRYEVHQYAADASVAEAAELIEDILASFNDQVDRRDRLRHCVAQSLHLTDETAARDALRDMWADSKEA